MNDGDLVFWFLFVFVVDGWMGLWISEVMGFKFLGVVVVERYVVKVIGFKFWFIVVVERYII